MFCQRVNAIFTPIHTNGIPFNFIVLILLSLIVFAASGCVTDQPVVRKQSVVAAPPPHGFSDEVARLAAAISPHERVAVSRMFDAETGDISSLGDQWRDRIEKGLRENGVQVVARQELALLARDAELFGSGGEDGDLIEKSGADVLVNGSYTITSGGRGEMISLTVKALRMADGTLLSTICRKEPLGPGWQALAARVRHNIWHRKISRVTGAGENAPVLSARLDKNPPCYRPGTPATLTVESEPGVYLYLLNLAADNTVTLLYPNRLLPDQPQPSGTFTFPPAVVRDDIQLVFYPLAPGKFCREAIKVVAARTPLDFSFLPVPENAVFTGAKGGDMKRMLSVLEGAEDWREVVVNYGVGVGCGR